MFDYTRLTDRGRRIAQFHQRAHEEGLTPSRWYALAMEQGISYRKTDFLYDYRVVRGIAEVSNRFKGVGVEKIPSRGLYVPRRYKPEYEYATIVKVRVVDIAADKEIERQIFVGHHAPISKKQAIDKAAGIYDVDYPQYKFIKGVAVGGWRRVT